MGQKVLDIRVAAQPAEEVIGLVRLVVRRMAEQSHQICNSLLSGMTGNLEFGRVESVWWRGWREGKYLKLVVVNNVQMIFFKNNKTE